MTPPDEGIGRFPWFSPSPPPPPPPQVLRSRHGEEESVQAALESLCDIAEPKVSGIQSCDGRCERSLSWLPEAASFLANRLPQGISNMSRLSYGRPHPADSPHACTRGPKPTAPSPSLAVCVCRCCGGLCTVRCAKGRLGAQSLL